MNETPQEPRPAGDGHGRPGGRVDPATAAGSSGPLPPDTDLDDDDDDDDPAEQSRRRRLLSGSRLAVVVGVVIVLAGAGLALALTSPGGGGEGDDESTGGSSDESTSLEDAAFQFAECMREHGIEDFPDPQVSEDGVSLGAAPEPGSLSPEEEAAQEACGHIMDEVSPVEGEDLSPEEVAERQDQALALAQCMRDRGWDFPDPEVTEDGGIFIGDSPEDAGFPGPGDPRESEFRQDQQECHDESGLETPGGAAGGAGGRGSDVPGGGS